MILTGLTRNRLKEVKTYDRNNPYQIGVNGVIDIIDNGEATNIIYEIDGVTYNTSINNNISIEGRGDGTKLFSFNTDNAMGTIFSVDVAPLEQLNNNILKEEVYTGVVFPPKVEDEIFIERESVSVFEVHSRLGEIDTLEQLEEYRNGYYNVQNLNI